MPGLTKFLGGKKLDYFPFNFGSGDYQVIDIKQLFEDMFHYDKLPEDFDLKRLIIVGSQNSGKSVLIRSLVLYIQKLYHSDNINAFMTNDIRILELEKYKTLFNRPIQLIIIDDAVRSGIDSRRSMSSANVDFTQRYFQIRHTLAEMGRTNGIIIVILATQSFSAIDKRIRDNVQCTIFKTYYRQKFFQEQLNYDEDIINFMKEATYESLIKSNLTAREVGVGVVQTGDIFQFRNRMVGESDVYLPLLLYESGKEDLIRELIAKLMTKFNVIFEIPDKIVKGYLLYEIDNMSDVYPRIRLTNSDMSYIIRWGVYLQYERMSGNEIDNNNIREFLSLKERVFFYLDNEKDVSLDILYDSFPEASISQLRNFKSEYLRALEELSEE